MAKLWIIHEFCTIGILFCFLNSAKYRLTLFYTVVSKSALRLSFVHKTIEISFAICKVLVCIFMNLYYPSENYLCDFIYHCVSFYATREMNKIYKKKLFNKLIEFNRHLLRLLTAYNVVIWPVSNVASCGSYVTQLPLI